MKFSFEPDNLVHCQGTQDVWFGDDGQHLNTNSARNNLHNSWGGENYIRLENNIPSILLSFLYYFHKLLSATYLSMIM